MSAGMEAGHFRSGSRDIQIKSKTSEWKAWRDKITNSIPKGSDIKRWRDSRKGKMIIPEDLKNMRKQYKRKILSSFLPQVTIQ